LYLTGRYHLNKFTDDGFFKARDSFQKAVDKDPDYALAYAGLAESYNLLSGWGAIAPNDGYPFAKAAALRALELDDDLAEAHTSLGIAKLFYDLDWAGAEMEFTRAVEINPSYSTAHHNQSLVFTMQGRFDEAKLSIARAREHDPLSILNIIMTGNIFYFQRQPSQAIDLYKEAVEMDPNSGLARWSLGNAYLSSNRTDEAIAEYQKAIPLSGGSLDEPASLGYALAISGNTNGARQVINDLKNRSKEKYIPQTLIAMIYGGLGDKEQAFESLNRAFIERDSGLLFLKVDPMFDPLRSDQRFVDILKRVNLAQ
jgi:tetratricopeptide (TPR) repeat protein